MPPGKKMSSACDTHIDARSAVACFFQERKIQWSLTLHHVVPHNGEWLYSHPKWLLFLFQISPLPCDLERPGHHPATLMYTRTMTGISTVSTTRSRGFDSANGFFVLRAPTKRSTKRNLIRAVRNKVTGSEIKNRVSNLQVLGSSYFQRDVS